MQQNRLIYHLIHHLTTLSHFSRKMPTLGGCTLPIAGPRLQNYLLLLHCIQTFIKHLYQCCISISAIRSSWSLEQPSEAALGIHIIVTLYSQVWQVRVVIQSFPSKSELFVSYLQLLYGVRLPLKQKSCSPFLHCCDMNPTIQIAWCPAQYDKEQTITCPIQNTKTSISIT